MSSSPLFRAQALKYATVRQYGSIVLLRPPILSWLTGAMCLAALAIVLFFFLASYTRREQVSGMLLPRGGATRIEASRAGVVRQLRVSEGQEVHAGDALLELAGSAPAPVADAARRRLIEGDARAAVVVRAPQDGVVDKILVQPGEAIEAGEVMAKLSPGGAPLEAELYATPQTAVFARVGMPVQLRYRAFPFQKFGQFRGVISEVSRIPLGGNVGSANTAHAAEPFYRIRVTLPRQYVSVLGQRQPLMAGMTLDASFLLESRKVYEWVLEPLSGLDGST